MNAEPRPPLAIYAMRDTKALFRLRPYREAHLDRAYCLTIEEQAYWLTLQPHWG